MRSIKEYIGSNNKFYGKEFRYFDGDDLQLMVYKICRVPSGIDGINNDTHCWVDWDNGGYIGGVEYTWGILRKNIEEGVWILV